MFCVVQAEACKSAEYIMCSVLYRRKRVSRQSTLCVLCCTCGSVYVGGVRYVFCVVQVEVCKSVEYVMCSVLYRRRCVSRWSTLCVLCCTCGGV